MAEIPRELMAIVAGMRSQPCRTTQKYQREGDSSNAKSFHLTASLADNVPIDHLENGGIRGIERSM